MSVEFEGRGQRLVVRKAFHDTHWMLLVSLVQTEIIELACVLPRIED